MKIVAIGGSGLIGRKLVDRLLNPLNSVAGIIAGFLLAILVFVIIPGSGLNEFSLARWLHILGLPF